MNNKRIKLNIYHTIIYWKVKSKLADMCKNVVDLPLSMERIRFDRRYKYGIIIIYGV